MAGDMSLGDRLQGMGAWFAGQGPQYENAQTLRDKQLAELDEQRRKAMLTDFRETYLDLQQGDKGRAIQRLDERLTEIGKLGGDPSHTAELMTMIQEGREDEALQGLKKLDDRAVQAGVLPSMADKKLGISGGQVFYEGANGPYAKAIEGFDAAAAAAGADGGDPATVREYKFYSALPPEQQAQYREMKRAQQIVDLGGGVQGVVSGRSAVPVSREGMTVDQQRGDYASAEGALAGAKSAGTTSGKLQTEFKLAPKVEAAVRQAVALVDQSAEQDKESRSNARALNVYEQAMNGVANALSDTTTGPVAGLIPAITENQQIAAGAIAAMAPVLKQIFRVADEGTFTDKDQELLLNMVPTRKDKPAARRAKIENIDSIVRAKLGVSGPQSSSGDSSAAPRQGGTLMQDASGNKAYVYPDGTVEEVR